MHDKLRAAFSAKEKAEAFLSNLEKLKEEKAVGDAQYRVLKIEYTQMREDAMARINTVKAYVKRELDDKTSKLNVIKQELAYLEARFKVGQMSSSTYFYKEKGPKQKYMALKNQISELTALLNSSGSAEIVLPEGGLKILGFNLGFSRKHSLGQTQPAVASTSMAETEQATPPASVEPPPKAPALVSITGLQIMPERVTEGGSVGIILTVTNITQANVNQSVDLKINDAVKDSRKIALVPGESQEITFVQVVEKPGDYKVDIDGLIGSFSVVPAETIRILR